jgi:predicted nuclease of predicted toxin-antitoxin system
MLDSGGATDQDIWDFAAGAHLTIVTKDDDFRGLSLLHGAPPIAILQVLTENDVSIFSFSIESITALLNLRKG